MSEIKSIVNRLAEQSETVAKMLLPGGKLIQREWTCADLSGNAGNSLKVCCSGEKVGIWCDFASGESGDLLDLWRQVKGISLSEALSEVKKYLGIKDQEFTRSKTKQYRAPGVPKNAVKPKAGSKVMHYLTHDRKLLTESISAYKISEAPDVGPWASWKEQKPITGPFIIFPYLKNEVLTAIKYLHLDRKNGKKFTLVEPGCEPICFGWHVIDPNAREVVICEGELDAASLYQYGYPAISVPFGAGAGEKQQWVDYDWNELERMELIYLCMDNDKEGHIAITELVNRLGMYRCKIVTLPCKDANECLKTGILKAEIDICFHDAKTLEPEELKSSSHFTASVMDRFYPSGGKLPGFNMPWDVIPFRFLRGELTVITGCNGHGKSLAWGQIALEAGMQGERTCIASLEMTPAVTLYRIVRQATSKKLPNKAEIADCLEWLSDKIWLFNLVGTGKIDRIMDVFDYAFRRHGIRQFVIDSMMKLGINEDDYNTQKALIDRLCDWTNTTGAHVHLVCHPRKEDENLPASKMAVKGTGAITDLAFNVVSWWKNQNKLDYVKRYNETGELPPKMTMTDIFSAPDAICVISKARNIDDAEGKYRLWYHPESMQYLSRQDDQPATYYKTIDQDVCPF